MPFPENYTYYDYLLNAIVTTDGGKVFVFLDVYLDFSCAFGKHWKNAGRDTRYTNIPAGASPTLDEVEKRVRFLVPWLHAHAHIEVCQYKNGGLYAGPSAGGHPGAGHRVGEQMEQVWSQVSRVAGALAGVAAHTYAGVTIILISALCISQFFR